MVMSMTRYPIDKEEKLAFYMSRNGSPSLFVTVYGLDGCAKELGHPLLGPIDFFSDLGELLLVH